jgi:hypothetical protein
MRKNGRRKILGIDDPAIRNPHSALKKEVPMYTNVALKDKILEMYPEIREHDLSMGLDFDEQKNAYVITFKRGTEELTTHLEKKDADECMQGIKCVYLGVQVEQFIKNFEERGAFGRKVA